MLCVVALSDISQYLQYIPATICIPQESWAGFTVTSIGSEVVTVGVVVFCIVTVGGVVVWTLSTI